MGGKKPKGSERSFVSVYGSHRRIAKRRGVVFLLTFEEWLSIWLDSGRYYERGVKRGQYVMARYGDKGPYAVGNVRIITGTENLKERVASAETRALTGAAHRGKLVSAETREKMSKQRTGKKHGPPSQETRDKIRKSLLGVKHTKERRANQRKARLRWLTTH